ncbi:MAG: DUF4097 family beta strand repeat-containing protein [Solibacillus sp.]
MKYKLLGIIGAVIISTVILIGFVITKEDSKTSTQYNIDNINTIEVQTNASNIVFVASENSEVTVQTSEKMKVDTTISGDTLRIVSDGTGNGIVNLKNGEILIDIPTSALLRLIANTDSGEIHIEDIGLSSLKATSISGEITVKRLTDQFTIVNESGNVEVASIGDSIGHSNIKTNSGHINVQFLEKPQAITAETKSGKITTALFPAASIKSQNDGYILQEGLETEEDFLQLNSITGNINIH